MLHKKMSITVANKSKIKIEVDQLLNADYQLLNQREDIPNTILECQLAQRNTLIQEYIQTVQLEYNIASPLKYKQIRSSSNSFFKKLNTSLKSSNDLQENILVKNNKNKKRLTLTSMMNSSVEKKKSYNPETNAIIKTPKFGVFQKQQQVMLESQVAEVSSSDYTRNRVNFFERKSSRFLNHLDSKEKPKIKTQPNQINTSHPNIEPIYTTAKKSHPDLKQIQVQSILLIQKSQNQRRTVKKNTRDQESEGQNSKSQLHRTFIHCNPINDKIQSRTKIQGPKIQKTRVSYRYCVGCEEAILQNSIRAHEKQCAGFFELSKLSDQDLYQKLKQKIKKIQEEITKNQTLLHPDSVQHLRSRSVKLVKQSRNRRQCSPQTEVFKQNYQGVMQIGKKWSSAVEEINKLRWFTRIVEKLEKMLQRS